MKEVHKMDEEQAKQLVKIAYIEIDSMMAEDVAVMATFIHWLYNSGFTIQNTYASGHIKETAKITL
jgi:hypothetical protein